jgi:glycosyltransferase involved in cell wall biosynthesis
MPKPTIAAVVPCYNEAARIAKVLRTLTSATGLEEMVCIDDGSADDTSGVIRRKFPKVELIRLNRNRGKAAAVLAGARKLKSEYILLVDADLTKPVKREFEAAINAIKSNPSVDMLVLRRVGKDLFTRSLRGDVIITGERIVRRTLLLAAIRSGGARGFQLEVALNQYMLETGKVVRWLPVSSTGVMSFKKLGFKEGLRKEARMFFNVFKYVGLRNLIWQYVAFGRQRI